MKGANKCKYISWAFGLVALTLPLLEKANAQGQDCVDIESDISRLQCFDRVFSDSKKPAPSIEESLSNLINLVEFYGDDHALTIESINGPCQIQSSYKSLGAPYGGTRPASLVRSYIDLSKVERIGRWLYSDGLQPILLYTERGFEGRVARYEAGMPDSIPIDEIDKYPMKLDREYIGRELRFFIVVKEYKADIPKIESALERLITACRK